MNCFHLKCSINKRIYCIYQIISILYSLPTNLVYNFILILDINLIRYDGSFSYNVMDVFSYMFMVLKTKRSTYTMSYRVIK